MLSRFIYILALAIIIPIYASGQSSQPIDLSIDGIPNIVHEGETHTAIISFQNTSNQTVNTSLGLKLDVYGIMVLNEGSSVELKPNEIYSITIPIEITTKHYDKGVNVVEIWPISLNNQDPIGKKNQITFNLN